MDNLRPEQRHKNICLDTGINGSAMPVDILINIAQDYAEAGYTHDTLRRIFSVNREVKLRDVQNACTKKDVYLMDGYQMERAADDSKPYGEK